MLHIVVLSVPMTAGGIICCIVPYASSVTYVIYCTNVNHVDHVVYVTRPCVYCLHSFFFSFKYVASPSTDCTGVRASVRRMLAPLALTPLVFCKKTMKRVNKKKE